MFLIVELNGLPGCGKSTLQKDLASEYLIEKVGTSSFSGTNKIFKFKKIFLLFSSSNFNFFLKVRRVFSKQATTRYLNTYERFIAYLYIIYLFDVYKNSSINIIIDEGLVQSLVALSIDCTIVESNLLELISFLKEEGINFKIVNCDISTEDSFSRHIKRGRRTAAIDFFSEGEFLEFIVRYDKRLEIIRACFRNMGFDNFSLNMTNSREVIVNNMESVFGEL